MNESITAPTVAEHRSIHAEALGAGLVVLAGFNIALAIFMAVAPHAFYTAIGPFGPFNDHYVRDVATFQAAIGIALLVAVRRPAWRVPVLGLTAIQFALHSVNHLLDIAKAHPAWTGYFDFISLAATTGVLAWLLTLALEQARTQERARR